MRVLRIQELTQGQDGFHAALSFDHGPEYQVTIRDPFSEQEEEQLEWYFEEYLRFPFVKQVQARDAAESIPAYGEALFTHVFADKNAYADYRDVVKSGLNTLQIEIAGSPQFHTLHWEALKDPQQPLPLALQANMVRKNLQPQPFPASIRPSPTINLLIVTARPFGKQDVGYRMISRPLVEALHQANVPMQIEILRPGTYKALENHLREVTQRHGIGYYHVIHFDVHGAVLSYEELQNGLEANHFLYSGRYARQDLHSYEGQKAFLSLEHEKDGLSDLVEATELANLFLTHQVPIAILNACQSGKQIGASETSLGRQLVQVGVQLVLAMSYSVTVSAAQLLMRTLYQRLLAGDELSVAIRHARMELYNHKERHVYFDQQIDLEDWLLPVVYQNQSVSLNPRALTLEESRAFHGRQAVQDRARSHEPLYGFVGRDLDILQIEKRLLMKRTILLVRGMGGAGKTTLLRHLENWWRTTDFVNRVFYFGYDERAWTRQHILTAIARQLLDQKQYRDEFQPLDTSMQQSYLARRLRAENHLLILDNLESITGAHLAILHTLPKKEQEALHNFLVDLVGGRTMVLLGSRSGEDWLARGTFEDNIYDLAGLDPEAASMLADRILERHNVTSYRWDADLQRLLTLLGGFPLALEVVLANLARQTPADVLTAFQTGDVALNVGDSEMRTENILRCIDYSHSNLSPEAQQLLLCLAPFTSVIWVHEDILNNYIEQLRQQTFLLALPFERLQEVLSEAMNWGLLSLDPHNPQFLQVQPTLPYFLRLHLQAPEYGELRRDIETAFRLHYNNLGNVMDHLLRSKNPQNRQAGQVLIQLEYENLMTALELAMADFTSIFSLWRPLASYLDVMQDYHRGLELSQHVLARLESYPAEKCTSKLINEISELLNAIGLCQFHLKQFHAAEESFQKELQLSTQTAQIDEKERKMSQAHSYHNLGMVRSEQQQWLQAEEYYQQALQLYIEYDEHENRAKIHYQLGIAAEEQEQWLRAEQYFKQALQTRIEDQDGLQQASAYYELGQLARKQQQWLQAEEYYQQALQLRIEYNDRYEMGRTHHELGLVAVGQRKIQQAEQHYQQALQIYIEYDDRFQQGAIYSALATFAEEQQQLRQAEQYYQQALQICKEYDDRLRVFSIHNSLAKIARNQQKFQQAEQYYQQMLQYCIEQDRHPAQAEIYCDLGEAAFFQGKFQQAEQYYQRALQLYIEFDPYSQQGDVYNGLGNAAFARQQWPQARDYYLTALKIFVAYKDINGIRMVLDNLDQMWQASGNKDLSAVVAPILGVSVKETKALLLEIRKNGI